MLVRVADVYCIIQCTAIPCTAVSILCTAGSIPCTAISIPCIKSVTVPSSENTITSIPTDQSGDVLRCTEGKVNM